MYGLTWLLEPAECRGDTAQKSIPESIAREVLPIAALAVGLFVLAASLSGCGPAESNATTADLDRTLESLSAARELDLSNAKDLSVGPIASGDYSMRADRAGDVMNELEHGRYVSHSQIGAALFVPPKSITSAQRARLIRDLAQARYLDERGWWDWTRDPTIAQDFSVQEKKAKRAIKDLETRNEVSWSEIQEGLQVPLYP
jgi:hypothetical protein